MTNLGNGSIRYAPAPNVKGGAPAAAGTARHTPTPVMAAVSEAGADTKVIWPKALSESEKATVARSLLPQAFEASPVARQEAGTGAARATRLPARIVEFIKCPDDP